MAVKNVVGKAKKVYTKTKDKISLNRAGKKPLSGSNSAHSTSNKLRLNKKLASQQQTGEKGVVIAGKNVSKEFRNAGKVAKQYGGEASDWVKKSSSTHIAPDGTKFETHWVENLKTGKRIEFKTKIEG